MFRKLLAASALYLLTASVSATVIVDNNSYTDVTSGSDFTLGQSATTTSGGPWDNISFNFIDSAGSPYANGTLYLLTQEYLGTPAGLNNSTPGFMATSTGTSGGIWDFDSSVTLQALTTYWFYMDTLFDGSKEVRFSMVNPYPGGSSYQADGTTGNFTAHFNKTDYYYDLAFSLQGTQQAGAVPEPGTLALLALGFAALTMSHRLKGKVVQ